MLQALVGFAVLAIFAGLILGYFVYNQDLVKLTNDNQTNQTIDSAFITDQPGNVIVRVGPTGPGKQMAASGQFRNDQNESGLIIQQGLSSSNHHVWTNGNYPHGYKVTVHNSAIQVAYGTDGKEGSVDFASPTPGKYGVAGHAVYLMLLATSISRLL